ncbi:MAG: hypothetical protein IJK81_13695 [Selenomonadaceae bacterium]|nr:hypothetical protein [Selenomonadaceae bacterium]
MNYPLSKQFTKISETSGTIQNPSRFKTIEVSNSNEPSSGLLLEPLQKYTFQNVTIYLRCIDGNSEARVVPFSVDSGGGGSSNSSSTSEQNFNIDDIWNDTTGDSSATDFDADVNDMWNNN